MLELGKLEPKWLRSFQVVLDVASLNQNTRTHKDESSRISDFHTQRAWSVPRLTLVAATEAHSTVSKVHNLIAKAALCEAYLKMSLSKVLENALFTSP